MSYHLLKYFALFLPIVIILYQLVPQKFRFIVLLLADYVFFWLISGPLLLYLLAVTGGAYGFGKWIDNINKTPGQPKEIKHLKKRVLTLAICLFLSVLLVLKYTNFFGEQITSLLNIFGANIKYRTIKFLVPIGISYYTLQIISYLTDIYRGTLKPEHNLIKIALYLSFFPQIMEGPISRYSEIADDLYEGKSLSINNVKHGYQRIAWGLFKKLVVADRVAAIVSAVYSSYSEYDGSVILLGVLMYTTQLYMEFSGCMDIIMGTGEIFGVKLPENFKQPFLAKDASDFWHRWHITLGTWFKDYIFYPVSLAKPVKNFAKKVKNKCGKNVAKFVAPTIALFCVWSSNGLWHGAKWTFIFYGMYYFVIIFFENITEEPVAKLAKKLHINRESIGYRIFKTIKLFIIVNIGEMFFRADSVTDGFKMLWKMLSCFHIRKLFDSILDLGADQYDLGVAGFGIIVVTIVGIFCEKGISIRKEVDKWYLPLRWIFWYAVISIIIICGAYGAGYDSVAMIYAGY